MSRQIGFYNITFLYLYAIFLTIDESFIFYSTNLKFLFRRIVSWLLFTALIVGLCLLFFNSYDIKAEIKLRITSNLRYFVVLFCSIFLWYVFYTSPKKTAHRGIRLLILMHFLLCAWIFLTMQFKISNTQLVAISLSVIVLFLSSLFRSWIRYVLGLFGFFSGVGVLAMSILPLFETIPSTQDFIQSQKSYLYVFWVSSWQDSSINIQNQDTELTFDSTMNYPQKLDLASTVALQYPARDHIKNQFTRLVLPDATTILILPQTKFSLTTAKIATGTQHNFSIAQWKYKVFASSFLDYPIDYQVQTGVSFQLSSGMSYTHKQILHEVTQRKNEFFVDQAWGPYLNNPTIQKTLRIYISTLFSIRPDKFANNMLNYENYQQYFSLPQNNNSQADFNTLRIQNAVESRTQKGLSRTMLFRD